MVNPLVPGLTLKYVLRVDTTLDLGTIFNNPKNKALILIPYHRLESWQKKFSCYSKPFKMQTDTSF